VQLFLKIALSNKTAAQFYFEKVSFKLVQLSENSLEQQNRCSNFILEK
jgi:hypothetical protein